MDDSEKESLAAALSKMSDEQLDELHAKSVKTLKELQEANNKLPETQKFLRSKGLTDVKQLDKAGREEMRRYLEKTLKLLLN